MFSAGAVVLATGGAGQVFPVTTNPAIATGDGVAAAWRAGAEVSDLEFVQFHPTALDHEAAPRFLVSEALRGEGAYLLDCDHERFMVGVHPLAELAPRDVVSREIERVMARCGRSNVWLDARHLGEEYLRSRFPSIWQACADAGYDLARDLVPVAPAAHYLIGGVRVDIDGRTSLPGLYASGECAASGLHGANRLASNSLLEGLVFSRRIARALASERASDQRAARGRRGRRRGAARDARRGARGAAGRRPAPRSACRAPPRGLRRPLSASRRAATGLGATADAPPSSKPRTCSPWARSSPRQRWCARRPAAVTRASTILSATMRRGSATSCSRAVASTRFVQVARPRASDESPNDESAR